MGDNPDRKSGRVSCRKGGVDRLIETARHLPDACLESGRGSEPADESSSELRPKVLRAATLVSGPTAQWRFYIGVRGAKPPKSGQVKNLAPPKFQRWYIKF